MCARKFGLLLNQNYITCLSLFCGYLWIIFNAGKSYVYHFQHLDQKQTKKQKTHSGFSYPSQFSLYKKSTKVILNMRVLLNGKSLQPWIMNLGRFLTKSTCITLDHGGEVKFQDQVIEFWSLFVPSVGII